MMIEGYEGRCLVAGELIDGRRADVINPATAVPFGTYHVASSEMLDKTVHAASIAAHRWRDTPLSCRRELLCRLADLVRDHGPLLSRLLTMEQGKPLFEATAEVSGAEAILRHYASVHQSSGERLFAEGRETYKRVYHPLGVVGGIIPWNFPFSIAAMKMAPALLAGNAIILKPSPTTPATTLEFGSLCADIVPPGLVQFLGDDGSIGPLMTGHPGIRKISFTGSTHTGRKVVAASANTMKRLTLELGGNDPAIVLQDADPGAAAQGIFRAAFTNAGQICGAVKRVYVHASLYDDFTFELAALVSGLVVGDGLDPNVTLGPLQNAQHHKKTAALLAAAKHAGQVVAEAVIPDDGGFFLSPTLISGLDERHPLVSEEQFAPILPLQRFENEEAAILCANDNPYGLTASVWSTDQSKAENIASQLDASLICINTHNTCPLDLGIGLAKLSGSGWLLGDEGIKEYMQSHLVIS
jgi:acyl-CoA reductase-like NAD-dependent aldehyde dehydrogenase